MFTGNEDQLIAPAEANSLKTRYQNNHPGQPSGGYLSNWTITQLLSQLAPAEVAGLRFYCGEQPDGSLELLPAAVRPNEDDILVPDNSLVGRISYSNAPYSGNEDLLTPIDQAAELTKRYRDNHPGKPKGGYISKWTITKLISQLPGTEIVGLRVYFGEQPDGTFEFIPVAVKSDGSDVTGLCADRSYKSPPYGGANNALNS